MLLRWFLAFVPVAIALEHLVPERPLWVFFASALAIVPLAGWMGRATEELAARTGEGVGGFLNATFGNAAELIIAIAALRAGLYDVVKASIAGSIVGNILLVLGAAMLAGGLRNRPEQHFNAPGARSQATMMTLATIALVVPAAFHRILGPGAPPLAALSVWISVVLLGVYAANLVFSLGTHRALFAGSHGAEGAHAATWSVRRAAGVLAGATAAIAWMSEILVGAIEPAAHALGLSDLFVGVFVVAILGNAAEHATAVTAAIRNRMDLSLSIAIGSSVQVALFVAPFLVLLSYAVAPAPMDLAFTGGLVLAVLLSVLIVGQVAGDGRSDWLKGLQLLAVYAILGLAFFFAPAPASGQEPEAGLAPEHEGYPLYQRLCASCHGVRADGRGPRAAVLSPPPPDLTRLAAARGGELRLDELTRVIDGRRSVRAHGEGPMPVWGEELVADVPDATLREQARIRLVQSLAEYVLAIQAPREEPAEPQGSAER